MIKLAVWLTMPTGECLKAGSLIIGDADNVSGALPGQFRYAAEYLKDPRAFPLDPINLPLTQESHDANRPYSGVHGVFEDSLPDDWGRKIMARRYNLGRNEQRVPHLLQLLANQGLGALSYAVADKPQTTASCRHLRELASLADKFERNPTATTADNFSLLFQAGSSPGGARPKALVEDTNGSYLAKFSSLKDNMDVVGMEAATMELSRRAGIETAATRIFPLGSAGKCLLVKRFDLNKAGGRNHLISAQSLLKADGYYNASYRDLAEMIKYISSQPGNDLQRIYRQMIFNVLIGNTDDHLKNFLMLHDESGWRLSPAFDLLPNIGFNHEHTLRIGLGNTTPDFETLLTEAKEFVIKKRQKAVEIIQEIYEAVAEWSSVAAEYGVPADDAQKIGLDIDQRLKKVGRCCA